MYATDPANSSNGIFYCYNFFTNAWTKWSSPNSTFYRCGHVSSIDDKLYIGETNANDATPTKAYIFKERKTESDTDFADLEESGWTLDTIDASTNTITVTAGGATVTLQVGMGLIQGSNYTYIKEQGTGSNWIVGDITGFTTGAFTAYDPIYSLVNWLPQYTKNPGIMKKWRELTFFFRDMNSENLTVGFLSDIYKTLGEHTLIRDVGQAWGDYSWGNISWGGQFDELQEIRDYFPTDYQYAMWVKISLKNELAFTNFALNGVSLIYDNVGPRIQ
jgi:hypothetical protein